MKSMHDIIEFREQSISNSTALVQKSNINKIDNLCTDCIGNIAAFLPPSDYIDFCCINRSIHTALQSPFILQTIRLKNKNIHHLHKFASQLRRLEVFKIPSSYYNQLNQIKFHHLRELSISCSLSENQMNIFSKCINMSNIDNLSISPDWRFIKWLKHFPNVTQLRFIGRIRKIENLEQKQYLIASLLPKLKVLDTLGFVGADIGKLLNLFMDTHCIESVACIEEGFVLSKKNISKLREVMICGEKEIYASLLHIIKNANHLTRIHVNQSDGTASSELQEIAKLFVSRPDAEFMHFRLRNKAQFVLLSEGIEIGLLDSMNIPRKQLTIEFDGQDRAHIAMDDIGLILWRVAHSLEAAEIDNFRVKYVMPWDEEIDEITKQKWIERFEKKYSTYFGKMFISYQDEWDALIISNKQCSMNGFIERWMNKQFFGEY